MKTSPKTNKQIILPKINKTKTSVNKNTLKKPKSMNKINSNANQLLDSFGFRRRAYKTRFLY